MCRTRRFALAIALLSTTLLLANCSLRGLEAVSGIEPTVRGEIAWRAADGRRVEFAGATCVSGDRASFRGVDLVAPPWVLRIAADPLEGLGAVVLGDLDGERHVFRAGDCRELAGDVQRTGWRVNDVWDVTGHLTADCRLDSGVELVGSVSFDHCH